MLRAFEQTLHQDPQKLCFRYIDRSGSELVYTYEETKIAAAGLALWLKKHNKGPRSYVAIDMPNSPWFVISALAAAYGGFTLVVLNNRLTSFEKENRLRDLQTSNGITVGETLTETLVETALVRALDFERAPDVFASGSQASLRRNGDSDGPFSYSEVIHFAERARAAFVRERGALVMFTSGTTGKPKAVPLTWDNICGAAGISNDVLHSSHRSCWQAALPLYHIGGFEVMVRSLLDSLPFLLYRNFNATRLLADRQRYQVTHISVVDKMLQDLLTVNAGRQLLRSYECILLGGAAPNYATLKQALAVNARVFASFGMTETSSQVANSLVTNSFNGALKLLPSYEAQIVNPDAQGFGQLALRGPGVFGGYLNIRSSHTAGGFFLTGDVAALSQGCITVRERSADMFVSGGENIYPAEIQEALLRRSGVTDAYVFGVDDPIWGKRPVAFIERRNTTGGFRATPPQQFVAQVASEIEGELSGFSLPKQLFALEEFPRTGIGKVDRTALKQRYEQRIELSKVLVYRIKQPLRTPFVTAYETMTGRESLVVEVRDAQGRIGISECVAFPSARYLPETLDQDLQILEQYLIPRVLSRVYLHPSEVSASLDECPEAADFPMAKGALEPALWDLYGKIVEQPLWRLIGGVGSEGIPGQTRLTEQLRDTRDISSQSLFVPAGVALGIMSLEQTLETIRHYVSVGYKRVKLKIRPGDDIERVRAVRQEFRHLVLVLDANRSYTEEDIESLRELDDLGVYCIEEPLAPGLGEQANTSNMLTRLSWLQNALSTPLCLDETLVKPQDYLRALDVENLRCFTLKIAKMGGIQPSLSFYRYANQVGIDVWMGGMFETSISKRMHAAFQTLPGIKVPGDISATTRYFRQDIATPALKVDDGLVLLNRAGYEYGLGCELDYSVLRRVLVDARGYSA